MRGTPDWIIAKNLPGGGHIIFVDSDDEILNNLVEGCVDSLSKSEADALVFGLCMKSCKDNGSVISEEECIPSKERYECEENKAIVYSAIRYMYGVPAEDTNEVLFENRSKYSQFLYCCCWCYRKSSLLCSGIRFHEDLKLREDAIFNCEFLMQAKKILYLPQVEYLYYKRSDGAANLFSSSVDIENKILLLKYRSIDISEWTYGSYVLSMFQLCIAFANEKNGYQQWKRYIALNEVKQAVKAVPLKGKLKLVLPLALCKCGCYRLVYIMISLLKKIGVSIGL